MKHRPQFLVYIGPQIVPATSYGSHESASARKLQPPLATSGDATFRRASRRPCPVCKPRQSATPQPSKHRTALVATAAASCRAGRSWLTTTGQLTSPTIAPPLSIPTIHTSALHQSTQLQGAELLTRKTAQQHPAALHRGPSGPYPRPTRHCAGLLRLHRPAKRHGLRSRTSICQRRPGHSSHPESGTATGQRPAAGLL